MAELQREFSTSLIAMSARCISSVFAPVCAPCACLCAGACELGVKLTGEKLLDKVEQAKKECLCLWLCNAKHKYYGVVWVLLSDGVYVMRIEFQGMKGPDGNWPEIQPNMSTENVYGHFRCDHTFTVAQ